MMTQPHPDRRSILAGAVALGALAGTPGWAQPGGAAPSPALSALFDTIYDEDLRRSPESATSQGLDKGRLAALRGETGDASMAGRAAATAAARDQLRRLEAFDRRGLSPADALNLDVVIYTKRARIAQGSFAYGGSGFGPSPYVVSQNGGAYQSTPDFLDTRQPVNDAQDADYYLARLNGFATELDAETGRLRHDSGLGVVPPDFMIGLILDQMDKTRLPAGEAVAVQSLKRRAAAKGLSGRYAEQAAGIWSKAVLPALDRQRGLIQALGARAGHDAATRRLPQGEAFYAMALKNTTTSSMSAAEVHKFGLDQARAISARLDGELRKQGMTKGSVAARMAALYEDPRQLYPDTDAGKAQAIAYCNDRLAAIRGRLPQAFDRMPPYKFEVRRVPRANEAGAASAYSQGAAIDGSRPGYVYFNLRDSAEWPKFCLATTVYHEGLPGHQLEGGLALSNANLPLIRKGSGFSGYGEGWALYAEQLADELGMYDDDPYGRLGYLKFQLFRANRCVVDTGIHMMGWSREQALRYFVDGEGEAPGFAAREVERYCASPGQACSYKIGHSVFVKLRDEAKAKQGAHFDLKAYHDAVLGIGRVPLDILEMQGRRWIARATA